MKAVRVSVWVSVCAAIVLGLILALVTPVKAAPPADPGQGHGGGVEKRASSGVVGGDQFEGVCSIDCGSDGSIDEITIEEDLESCTCTCAAFCGTICFGEDLDTGELAVCFAT